MLLTDEQIEECLLAAEVEAAAPEEEWLLYGRKVEQLVRAELERENERLRSAAEFAAHNLEQARIWNGTDWHYNPLHPLHYRSALERLRDALDAAIDQAREKG